MTVPIVSALVAATIIILQQILMFTVGIHRARASIGVGFGEDQDLERKIRRHGNLAENGALFIATLALAEMVGVPQMIVLGFGGAFVLARVSHAIGMGSLSGSHLADGGALFKGMRAFGAFATVLSGIGLGAMLIYVSATSLTAANLPF